MGRRFTEQQVGDIIKRAAEYQLRQRVPRHPSPEGISESELRSVAEELGIGAEALEKALSKTGIVTQEDSGSLKSINRTLIRILDREINDDDLAIVTDNFPPMAGTAGAMLTLGKSVQYRSLCNSIYCSVRIFRQEGSTKLKIESNAWAMTWPLQIAIMLSCFSVLIGFFAFFDVIASIPLGLFLTLPVPIVLISVGIWANRAVMRSINQKILDAFDATTTRLLELGASQTSVALSGAQSAEGLLEVDVQTRIQE